MSSQRQDIVAAAINRGPDDEPRGEFLLGFIVFCLFFIGFGVWSATASLRAAAVAPGQIVVVGHHQAVQHPEGGVVARLFVKENDRVEAGQVLLELSDTQVGSEAQRLTNSVASLQARRARLIAERDGASEVAEPEAFRTLSDPDAREQAAVLMSEQRRLFAERRRARTTEAGVFQTRQDQLRQQKTGAISQIDAVKEQIRLIEDELAAVIDLEAKGLAPTTRLRSVERQKAQLLGSLGQLQASVAQTDQAIGEAILSAQNAQETFRAEVATELQEIDLELSQLSPQSKAAESRLARTQIKSPATGQVVGLSVFTEGGVVAAGQQLMEIVPESVEFVIEARALPTDADDLHPGLVAEVRFSGLPTRSIPMVTGEVRAISADRLIDERTGESYFRVEVTVPPSELNQIVRDIGGIDRLRPGIPAEVVIPLQERTLLAYLTEPLTASLRRAFREH